VVGFILDASADGAEYAWGDFRLAWFFAVGVVWIIGVVGLVISRAAMARWRTRQVTQ
jgi:hypothetical protein